MSTRRVVDWRIEPGEDDTETLYLRNRRVLRDASPAEVRKHLRRNRQQGQSVHLVAEDGYITDITRAIERRQPSRRTAPARKRHRPVRMPLLRF